MRPLHVNLAKLEGNFGLGLIIQATTGIMYAQRCGFNKGLQRMLERFYIPLGHPSCNSYAKDLLSFFTHLGQQILTQNTESLGQLKNIIAHIPYATDQEQMSLYLKLDLNHIDQCMMAWIPVKTVYGPGILTFDNCD